MNNINANHHLNVNFTELGHFAEIHRNGNLDNENGIVQLTKDNRLTYGGDRSYKEYKHRTDDDRAANNEVRAELLKSLGDALGIKGYTRENNGRLKFSDQFVADLKRLLGKDGLVALKFDNFSISKGYVTSGKPLTERRLTYINRFLAQSAQQAVAQNPQNDANNQNTEIRQAITGANPSQKLQDQLRARFSDESITFFSSLAPESKDETFTEMFHFLEHLLPNATGRNKSDYDRTFTAYTFHKALKPLVANSNDATVTFVDRDRALTKINSYIADENKLRAENNKIAYLTPENFKREYERELGELKKNYADNLPDGISKQISIWKYKCSATTGDPAKDKLKFTTFTAIRDFKTEITNYRQDLKTQVGTKCSTAIEKLKACLATYKYTNTGTNATGAKVKGTSVKGTSVKGTNVKETNVENTTTITPKLPEFNNLTERLNAIERRCKDDKNQTAPSSKELREMLAFKGLGENSSVMETFLKSAVACLKQLMNNTDPDTYQGATTALVDAFKDLSELFLLAGDPPDVKEAQTKQQIQEGLSWTKAEPAVPDSLPKYNRANNDALMNRFENLLSTFRRMKDEPQSRNIMNAVDEIAKGNNHEKPTVADFITHLTSKNTTRSIRGRFATLLKNHLPKTFQQNFGSEKLMQLLTDAQDNILKAPASLDSIAKNLIDTLKEKLTAENKNRAAIAPGSTEEYIQEVKKALVDALHFHTLEMDSRNKQEDYSTLFKIHLSHIGGGLNSIHEREFDVNEKTYKSVVTPKNQLLNTYNIKISPDDPPLANLAMSELKDKDGNALITFNRFGVVGTSRSTINEHYRQLAIQTFLTNQELRQQAEKNNGGEIELPLWRVDLAGNNDLDENKLTGGLGNVEFEMKTPDGKTIKVNLKPTAHHFHMPIDSSPIPGQPLINSDFAKDNEVALQKLEEAVEKFTCADETKKKAVENLMAQIKDGFSKIANLENQMPKDPNEIVALEYGPKLTRLGARIAVLTSLLGDVPSINCNWGRDRTGAMDTECKLVALKVNEFIANQDPNASFITPVILEPGQEDPDIALRTRLLEETGNQEIAGETNCTTHPINVRQCGKIEVTVNGETETVSASGFDKLFALSA